APTKPPPSPMPPASPHSSGCGGQGSWQPAQSGTRTDRPESGSSTAGCLTVACFRHSWTTTELSLVDTGQLSTVVLQSHRQAVDLVAGQAFRGRTVTPEAGARKVIDQKLVSAGWIVQDMKQVNLGAGLGVAVREYPTETGPAD